MNVENRRAKGRSGADVADPIKLSPKSVERAASKSPSRRTLPARNREHSLSNDLVAKLGGSW